MSIDTFTFDILPAYNHIIMQKVVEHFQSLYTGTVEPGHISIVILVLKFNAHCHCLVLKNHGPVENSLRRGMQGA